MNKMATALGIRNSEGYLYALGRKHGGADIDPEWFAAQYESAKASWNNSPGTTGKWIGVAAYFERWLRAQQHSAA